MKMKKIYQTDDFNRIIYNLCYRYQHTGKSYSHPILPGNDSYHNGKMDLHLSNNRNLPMWVS